MKTQFTSDSIERLFDSNMKKAKMYLSKLQVYCGSEPSFSALSGWVFEQTIQYCIRKELKAAGLRPSFGEQVNLSGRSRADLVVGKVAIEIKTGGLFSSDSIARYRKCRALARESGFEGYLYLTWFETYKPYRTGIIRAVGPANAFFLDETKDWNRFIGRLMQIVKRTK